MPKIVSVADWRLDSTLLLDLAVGSTYKKAMASRNAPPKAKAHRRQRRHETVGNVVELRRSMGTKPSKIHTWLVEGQKKGATHVLVMCDTFDYDEYPVFVMPGEDARERVKKCGEMHRVMECYSLALDIEAQLAEYRAHHYD